MLEFFDAQVAPNDLIKVQARLEGVPAPFLISMGAIADFFQLQDYDLESCKAKLEGEWHQLAEPLEEILRSHGVATLITTELLNM